MKLGPTNTNTQQVERGIQAGNTAADETSASAEQAADLANLETMATGAPAGQVATVPEPEGPTLQEEIAAAMGMAVAMLAPVFPSLRGIYTPETMGAASGAIAAVCEKHGWLNDGFMGQYGPEIACVAIVGPLGFATYQGVSADLAAMAKNKPVDVTAKDPAGVDLTAAPAPPAPAREGPAVTFGSVPQ